MTRAGDLLGMPNKKRDRRTKAEMGAIRAAIVEAIELDAPTTVRSVFYRTVSMGAVAKTEAEYKGTIGRLLANMRREGVVPWNAITDATRWRRKPQSFRNLSEALSLTQDMYRRALWAEQPVYVEIWCEKEAISGVLYDVTSEWDVPLHVTKGYSSLTYLHACALDLAAQHKPCFIYYFGDHDPSGLDIPRKVEAHLRKFAPDTEIRFVRAAVTEEQIDALKLPTRPTKKSDSRARSFKGESVEVDAIPPPALREIVRACITQHVDRDLLERTQLVEDVERDRLDRMIARMRGAA